MKIHNMMILIIAVATVPVVARATHAKGNVEISLSMDQQMDMYSNGGRLRVRSIRYAKPVDNTFLLQKPLSSVYVILKNNSKSFVKIYGNLDNPVDRFSFELTDEDGRITVIKKKPATSSRSDVRPGSYAKPGYTKVFNIHFDSESWNGIPSITPGKIKTYTLRAVFDNKVGKYYSVPYKLILDGVNSPAGKYLLKKNEDKETDTKNSVTNSDILILSPTEPSS